MTKTFTIEEKQKFVARYFSGESVKSMAVEAGISKSTVYNWINLYKSKVLSKEKSFTRRETNQFKQTVKRQSDMIKILKSVNCTVNSPLKYKLYELEKLYGKYSVHVLCDSLEVSRSTFYNHILINKKENTLSAKKREELRPIIKDIFDSSGQIYGSKKIAAVLKNKGYKAGEHLVSELMLEMNLFSMRTDSKKMYNKLNKRPRKRNLLKQQFNISAPNQVWCSDVTYFKLNKTTYYICVILDLFSRQVISYKIAVKNSTQLTKATFKAAYESREPKNELIFHSDRGANYISTTFQKHLASHGVIQSFSNPGTPYDNSVMESFFSSLKRESLYRTDFTSEKSFKRTVDKYMSFYNHERPHSMIKYKTPCQAEEEFARKHGVSIE